MTLGYGAMATGLLLSIALLAACDATQKSAVQSSSDDEVEEYCLLVADLGRSVMDVRQMGISLESQLANSRKLNPGNTVEDRQIRELKRGLIMDAYEVQRFTTRDGREKATEDFGEQTLIECLRNT